MLARFFFFCGLSSSPLYLVGSGGIQIAHALLAVALAIYAMSRRALLIPPGLSSMLLVSIVALLSESFYVIFGGDIGIKHAIFFLYNTAIFAFTYSLLMRSDRNTDALRSGALFACVLATTGLFVFGFELQGTAVVNRAVGTFNNPNQLGYFACLIFSLLSLLCLTDNLRREFMLMGGLACVLMALASLSKAAIVSVFVPLIFIAFVMFPARKAIVMMAAISLLGLVFFLLSNFSLDINQFLAFQRIMDIGSDGDDNLAARGYFILGAPEANTFDLLFGFSYNGVLEVNHGDEVHSTFVFVLGTYGVIAGFAYLYFLYLWSNCIYRSLGFIGFTCICVPVLLFGITHTGVRYSLFYILVASSFALTHRGVSINRRVRGAAR